MEHYGYLQHWYQRSYFSAKKIFGQDKKSWRVYGIIDFSLFEFASFTASIMKEVTIMFLILLLVMIALILISVTIIAVSVGGSVFILIFSDVIVCIGFIIWLIVKLINGKR